MDSLGREGNGVGLAVGFSLGLGGRLWDTGVALWDVGLRVQAGDHVI